MAGYANDSSTRRVAFQVDGHFVQVTDTWDGVNEPDVSVRVDGAPIDFTVQDEVLIDGITLQGGD